MAREQPRPADANAQGQFLEGRGRVDSAQLLQATIDASLDPHVYLRCVRDEVGAIVDFEFTQPNRLACEYLQMDRDALEGARLLDLLPGLVASGLFARYANAVDTNTALALDDTAYSYEPLDEERRYDIRGVRVGDGLSFSWRDVTERFRAATSLARSEEDFRILAEHSSDVIMRTALDSTIQWVSPSCRRAFGWEPEEMVGLSGADLIHPDDLGWFLRLSEETNATADAWDASFRVRRADGTYGWVDGSSAQSPATPTRPPLRVVRLRDADARIHAMQELSRTEQRFRTALEVSAAGMATTDLDRRFTQVNPALCRMLDRDADWLLAHNVVDVVHPDDIEADRALRAQLLVGAFPSTTHEKRLVRADGQVLWVQHAIALIRDDQGQPESYVSQFFDVTESRRTGILIEAATEAIVDPFAIWAVSGEGPDETRLLRANPAMWSILMGTRQSLVGHTLAEIFPPPLDSIAHALQADLATAVHGKVPFVAADQTGLNTPDGATPRIWRPTLSPIGEGLVAAILRDVTEEVQESRRLALELERANEAASRDPLTGLFNRRALMSVLTAMLSHPPRAGTRLAVLYCDIDGLKEVNDTLGHAVGDQLIVEVSGRMQGSVRIDDTVARLGGDEFVVVLTSLGSERDAVEVATHVCSAVAEPVDIGGGTVRVTLSVGVAIASPSEDPAVLLDRADRALYRAKQAGKARVVEAVPSDSWVI